MAADEVYSLRILLITYFGQCKNWRLHWTMLWTKLFLFF